MEDISSPHGSREDWKQTLKRSTYCPRSCTVGPVILVPEFVTQSVRNVWSPLTALHHRVVRSCRSPGDNVIVSEGLLTCKSLKKFRR